MRYTYAETPLGDVARNFFDLARNPYDRLGHFAQGFVPAILVRELMIRLSPLKRGGWLFFLVSCVCLAFSAFFEFIEWWAALAMGAATDAFLATQGDVWDTQWDMFLCLCGRLFRSCCGPDCTTGSWRPRSANGDSRPQARQAQHTLTVARVRHRTAARSVN